MAEDIDTTTGEIFNRAAAQPQIHQLLLASAQTEQVWTALLRAQGVIEMPQRTKTGRVQGTSRGGRDYSYEYRYAPLEEVLEKIRQPMLDENLGKQQYLVSHDGMWVMRTIIFHESGQWVGCDYPVFFEESRGAQGFASGVTYARRYGLMLALGLAAEDDDDAALASAPATMPTKDPTETADEHLTQRAWEAARSGMVPLQGFWSGLAKNQRTALGNALLDKLKVTAGDYDASRANGAAAANGG